MPSTTTQDETFRIVSVDSQTYKKDMSMLTLSIDYSKLFDHDNNESSSVEIKDQNASGDMVVQPSPFIESSVARLGERVSKSSMWRIIINPSFIDEEGERYLSFFVKMEDSDNDDNIDVLYRLAITTDDCNGFQTDSNAGEAIPLVQRFSRRRIFAVTQKQFGWEKFILFSKIGRSLSRLRFVAVIHIFSEPLDDEKSRLAIEYCFPREIYFFKIPDKCCKSKIKSVKENDDNDDGCDTSNVDDNKNIPEQEQPIVIESKSDRRIEEESNTPNITKNNVMKEYIPPQLAASSSNLQDAMKENILVLDAQSSNDDTVGEDDHNLKSTSNKKNVVEEEVPKLVAISSYEKDNFVNEDVPKLVSISSSSSNNEHAVEDNIQKLITSSSNVAEVLGVNITLASKTDEKQNESIMVSDSSENLSVGSILYTETEKADKKIEPNSKLNFMRLQSRASYLWKTGNAGQQVSLILVQGRKLLVMSDYLKRKSTTYANHLESDRKETPFVVDLKPASFEMFLEYCYFDKFPKLDVVTGSPEEYAILSDLWNVAVELQATEFEILVVEELFNHVTADTFIAIHEKCNERFLAQNATRFPKKQFFRILMKLRKTSKGIMRDYDVSKELYAKIIFEDL